MSFLTPLLTLFSGYLKNDRLAHAYLVDGVPISMMPDLCADIRSVISDSLPDQHILSPEEGSASIKVDQIRVVLDRLSRKPHKDKHIICIYPAESMNLAAANALLKLLEEPPGSSCFILLSQRGAQLLPTIRSRVLMLRCPLPSIDYFADKPNYDTLYRLYKHNPAALLGASDALVLLLEKQVLDAKDPLRAISELRYNSLSELISSVLQLYSVHMGDEYAFRSLWLEYEKLISLSKCYGVYKNLNEKATIDQLGISLIKLKSITH